jgi:glucuronate isomerase
MDQAPLAGSVPPRQRVRAILRHADRFDNTVQYSWFLEIARTFLGFTGQRLDPADADVLCDAAERLMAQPDWEEHVLLRSNLEKVFLTNEFDDPLEDFDTARYVPCLRTDDLVFRLDDASVRQRLAAATGIEPGDVVAVRKAVRRLFEHFTARAARACAVSLPPDFAPAPGSVFWILAEHCREFNLPFDLMLGVNRRVYPGGVYQGQDLFDQRTSLIQYASLFNAFPEVTFCVSVLTHAQNQELAAYSWIFPNVITSGHWWYSNVPVYIELDTRARLQAVPKTKQIGYYSDMYKLEFALPKYNMYRRILARALTDDFVRPGITDVGGAIDLARLLLRDNARRIFRV